jgi:hypothetical protein
MSDIIRIWVEISHSSAYRAGGWSYVRAEGSALSGAAGGERTASPDAIALTGLIAALQDLPTKAGVEILSATPRISAIGRHLVALNEGGPAPDEDLERWAQLTAVSKTRTVRFASCPNAPRTPSAFASAWAELAADKAKTRPFSAAIPKSNLAKAGVPA